MESERKSYLDMIIYIANEININYISYRALKSRIFTFFEPFEAFKKPWYSTKMVHNMVCNCYCC